MASSFACQACLVRLPHEEALKAHYKSPFHQFNLTRRTRDFAPISYADFEAAVAVEVEQQKAAERAAAQRLFICKACSRTFATEGQCESHLQSKKHAARVREILEERVRAPASAGAERAAEPAATAAAEPTASLAVTPTAAADGAPPPPSEDEEEEEEELVVTSSHCVFCFEEAADVEANLRHMRVVHSFFVPDVESLVDPDGLITYLLAKVVGGACVWCEGPKRYESSLATQQHMEDKNHCRIHYDEERHFEEYAQFYSYDYSEDEEGGEGEGTLAVARTAPEISVSGDLDLGDGRVAHHRDVMRYLNQTFAPVDERTSAQIARVASEYRAAGASTRMRPAEAAALRAGVGTRGNRVDVRAQKRDGQYWAHLKLHTGILMNDIRRKHFRVAVRKLLLLPSVHVFCVVVISCIASFALYYF